MFSKDLHKGSSLRMQRWKHTKDKHKISPAMPMTDIVFLNRAQLTQGCIINQMH